MSWITRRCWQAACLGLSLVVVSCRSKPADELLRLAPRLSPEIAVHLVNDDGAEFRVFARHTEADLLGKAVWALLSAPPTTSLQEFLPAEAAIAPYARRAIDGFFSDHRLDLLRHRYDAYWRCAPTERLEIVRRYQAKERLAEDNDLPVAEKATRLLQLIEAYEDFPDIMDPSNLYGEYAGLLTSLRRDAEIPHFLTLGIDAAVRFQDYYMACQLLGTLGFHYGRTGDIDAMESCYDRALDYARRIDSWQEARILSFRASHYRANGQLAIARDLLFEAQDRCRELRVGVKELRPVTDTLKFLAGLECWSLVGRGLPRAEMVYRRGRSTLAIDDAELEGVRLQVLRARYCANVDRCDEARTLALEVAAHIDGWTLGAPRTAISRLEAAQALAKCGHDADARPLLERGLQLCIDAPVPALIDEYAVELSSSQLALGDLQACAKTLQQYPIADGSRIAVRHATVGLRLAMVQQDRAAAFAALQIGLQRLAEMESELGASPEGYIALAANDELRRLGHVLLEASPEAGYAFEMRWREPTHRGPRFVPGHSEADFVAELVADARQAVARITAREAMHCVYDVRDDAVVRFTATASGISKQRLPCSIPDLQARVSEVCAALSRPASDTRSAGGERVKTLRLLAEWLLPESVRAASETPLLLLTANGCLSRLPFEALNLDARAYVPLLERGDVATLRYWGSDDPTRSDSVLVVSQPIYSATLQRRYSILKEELPISAVEAQAVQQALPRVVHLHGPDAIKRNLVDRWEHARSIYFAGHLVRNPELPYVMFIPMSQTPSGSEKDSYLEVADVRQADLTNCRLVVLSSCASGASYLDAKVGAPSLADVFLDAGARAVVSTAWAVRDDAAGRVMGSFVREYARDENDPISALCKARREVAEEKPDPHVWVAYSIAVQGLGRPSGGPIASAGDKATPSLPAPIGAPR